MLLAGILWPARMVRHDKLAQNPRRSILRTIEKGEGRMKHHRRYEWILGFTFACLLGLASFSTAQEAEKSPITIGGAIGINYAYGSYENNDRGENGGGIDVDVFRLNADLAIENVIGRLEYRWQSGGAAGLFDTYSMIHTAWLGYDAGESGTFKAGIVRVPFGPTAYGVSTSYFFRPALVRRALRRHGPGIQVEQGPRQTSR